MLNLDLIQKNDRIIVAVSGGIDSMVMLDCLYKLKAEYNLFLAVCHINHHKRPSAINDLLFVKETAQRLGLDFIGYDYHHEGSENFHKASRKARLDYLLEASKKYSANKIALAHHADDLVETILMRLLRGSYLPGYGGINEQFQIEEVTIIRPLLGVSRQEITAYQSSHLIAYQEDDSNQEDVYTRNRFRHTLVPFLSQENPQYAGKFHNFSKYIQEAYEHIKKNASLFVKKHVEISPKEAVLPIRLLNKEDRIIQKEVLIQTVGAFTGDLVELAFEQLESLCNLLDSTKTRHELDLDQGLIALKSYDKLILYQEPPQSEPYEYVLNKPGEIVLPNGYTVSLCENTVNINGKYIELWYNDLDFILPITIRNRRPGDRLLMPYGTKKLKTFFIEKRVPHLLRDELPLCFDKFSNLLWIPGYYQKKPDQGNTKKLWLCYGKGNENARSRYRENPRQ